MVIRIGAGLAAAVAPLTVIPPCMPAWAWPGIEQMKVMPVAGTSTSTVFDGARIDVAAVVVPSANVMSCGIAPVFFRVTA